MSDTSITLPKSFSWSGKLKGLWALFVIIGMVTFLLALRSEPQRAWANFLVDYFYWLCISLGGVFFAALQYLAGARWSSPVRRISEVFIAYLPIALILSVVLFFGMHSLYEWSHPEVVAKDPILSGKAFYLNKNFFVLHLLVLILLALGLGAWILRNSTRQDHNGNPRLTKMNIKISAPLILAFGWMFTFVSIDLIMSLSPHWYSTMFGVYCWAGLFYSTLAMITLWTILLKKKGVLKNFVNENHYHDLGKLMFAFLVFWGYIAFSQFMLIWYANLPEETSYMLVRVTGDWAPISILLALGKFVVPFFFILSRPAKRKENFLLVMTIWYLIAQWIDIYWMVFPTFFSKPIFGLIEIGMFLGFLGLFCLSVGRLLSKVSPVAIKDPYLEDGLHFHQ